MSTSPDLLCTARKSDMKAAVALALLTVGAVLLECDSRLPEGAEGYYYAWSAWGSWSSCSATCDGGSQTRSRYCKPDHRLRRSAAEMVKRAVRDCVGTTTESKYCCIRDCSGWAEWSPWSGCDNSCTKKTRTRTCMRPPCPGSNCETSPCRSCMKSFSAKYTTSCGFWSWRRCTRYRTAYTQGCC